MPVVIRRCRAGEIVNLVDFHIEHETDIVTNEIKALMVEQVLDIAPAAGKKIIATDDLVAGIEQSLAQV